MAEPSRQGQEWKNARYDKVTGTDVAVILGQDPSCSRKLLFKTKILREDRIKNPSPYLAELLEIGNLFEPVARESCIDAGLIDDPWGGHGKIGTLTVHGKHPWFAGTPDHVCPSLGIIYEFKCHGYPTFTEACPIETAADVKNKYYLQIQSYLEIMDYPTGVLFSWTFCNGCTAFNVHRDRELFKKIIDPLKRFYDEMQTCRAIISSGVAPLETALKLYSDGMKFEKGEKAEWTRVVSESKAENTTQLPIFPQNKS